MPILRNVDIILLLDLCARGLGWAVDRLYIYRLHKRGSWRKSESKDTK